MAGDGHFLAKMSYEASRMERPLPRLRHDWFFKLTTITQTDQGLSLTGWSVGQIEQGEI